MSSADRRTQKTRQALTDALLNLLQATPPPASQHQDRELTARFIAGGWVDLMKWWVDAPSPIASDALVARMCHLAHSAIEMHTARLA